MFQIRVHKRVSDFLENLDEKERTRCKESIDELAKNPFIRRSRCDIKKLGGKENVYRLRVGSIRFNYVAIKDTLIIYIDEAFYRERGYR